MAYLNYTNLQALVIFLIAGVLQYGHAFSIKPFIGYKSVLFGRHCFALFAEASQPSSAPPPPPPSTGRGEWSDWDSDAYLEEEFDPNDDDDDGVPFFPSSLFAASAAMNELAPTKPSTLISKGDKASTSVYRMADQELWSEEAPYFDEADVQDDEGNWGRAEAGKEEASIGSGKSSAWMTRAEYASFADSTPNTVMASSILSTPTNVAPSPSPSAVSSTSPSSSSASSTVVKDGTPSSLNAPVFSSVSSEQSTINDRLAKLEKEVQKNAVEISAMKGFIAGACLMFIAVRIAAN